MSGLLHAKPQQVLVEPPSAPIASPWRVFVVEATHAEVFWDEAPQPRHSAECPIPASLWSSCFKPLEKLQGLSC